jgi:hypothetical protein
VGRNVEGGRCRQDIVYGPLPSQATFHLSKARFKGFSGPIGSGKSQALCQEAIKLAYINAGRLALIGAPTYPMLRDATQTAMLEILVSNDIPYELNKAENTLVLKDTSSKILFRSLDEYERLRGTNLAWFGIDELTYCQEEAWLRLEGRLRDGKATKLCGFAVWTPKGFDWVYRKFIAERVDGYEVSLARAFENRYLLDKVPDFYQRLEKSYDAGFYQQEVLGEYLAMNTGLAYKGFDRGIHVREMSIDPTLPLRWSLDFNVDPMSSVVAQILRDGTVQVVDEIVISRAMTEDACNEFMNRYPNHPAPVLVYGDASGNQRQSTGPTDYQMIREFFARRGKTNVYYQYGSCNPLIRDRVMVMNARLKSAAGDASLFVSPRCVELIKDFEEVCFKKGSMVVDKDKDSRRTHLSDALGYMVFTECRPQQAAGEQSQDLGIC